MYVDKKKFEILILDICEKNAQPKEKDPDSFFLRAEQ